VVDLFPQTQKHTLGREVNLNVVLKPNNIKAFHATSILPSQHGSRGQNECHISVSVLGNISTAFLALSVDGNISTNRTVYEKGTLTRSALNNKH